MNILSVMSEDIVRIQRKPNSIELFLRDTSRLEFIRECLKKSSCPNLLLPDVFPERECLRLFYRTNGMVPFPDYVAGQTDERFIASVLEALETFYRISRDRSVLLNAVEVSMDAVFADSEGNIHFMYIPLIEEEEYPSVSEGRLKNELVQLISSLPERTRPRVLALKIQLYDAWKPIKSVLRDNQLLRFLEESALLVLVSLSGGFESIPIRLQEGQVFTIGKSRDEADGFVSSPIVSRVHCAVSYERGRFFISDRESTNGTYVNGNLLRPLERYPLRAGDILEIGRCRFRVEPEDENGSKKTY